MSTKDTDRTRSKDTPTFSEIKAIMDHLAKGKEDKIPLHHGNLLKWTTARELCDAVVQRPLGTYQLIAPELIGQAGTGHEALLVRVLTGKVTLDGREYPRMPKNGNIFGQYATQEQLDRIAQWIEAGCPE